MAALKTYRARVRKEDESYFAAVTKEFTAQSMEAAQALAESEGWTVLNLKPIRSNDASHPSPNSVRSTSLILTFALALIVSFLLSLLPAILIANGFREPQILLIAFLTLCLSPMLFYGIAIFAGHSAARPAIIATRKTDGWHEQLDNHPLWYAFRLIPFFVVFAAHLAVAVLITLFSQAL